jgi:hypothetical protein
MDFFETFAQCAITFAGFAAVHAALQGSQSARGVLRSFSTVLPGMTTFVLALLPLLLESSTLNGAELWQLVSAIGFVAASLQLYLLYWLHDQLNQRGIPPQAPITIRIALSACLIALGLMLYNAMVARDPLLYGLALILQIFQGILALMHSFWLAMKFELERPDPGED